MSVASDQRLDPEGGNSLGMKLNALIFFNAGI